MDNSLVSIKWWKARQYFQAFKTAQTFDCRSSGRQPFFAVSNVIKFHWNTFKR